MNQTLHIAIHGDYSKLDEITGYLSSIGVTYKDVRIEQPTPNTDSIWSFFTLMLLDNPHQVPFEAMRMVLGQVGDIKVYNQNISTWPPASHL